MSGYELRWKHSALKELRKLPKQAVIKLVALAEALINEPYPSGCRKLSGTEHTYRVRSGDYRIIYQVNDGKLLIEVIKTGHRKDVYR